MKTIEEILASGEAYSVEGAIESFVEFIDGLEISTQTKEEILCRFNSAVGEAGAIAITQSIAAFSGIDFDKLSADMTKHYDRTLLKDSIKAKTAALEKERDNSTL